MQQSVHAVAVLCQCAFSHVCRQEAQVKTWWGSLVLLEGCDRQGTRKRGGWQQFSAAVSLFKVLILTVLLYISN